MGPRAYGIDRAEYTIGVSGCGDRKTFVVICPDGGDGCFAAGPGRFYERKEAASKMACSPSALLASDTW